ncbi:MAG: hypothetical protein RL518_2764 [Pseudomonadota bacterium]|jgi:hypothetical protein
MTGQVAYSNPDAPARNHQLDALSALQEWSARLESIVSSTGKGETPELNQNAVSYLSVLYLYCSAKQGPCPFILDAILDADIAVSRHESSVKCPLTTRFFKSYVAHELDERGKFLFSLTQGLEIAKFNTVERPRYVECKETVAAIVEDKEVLGQRFGEKGSARESVAALRALLAEVQDKKLDIFEATGMVSK